MGVGVCIDAASCTFFCAQVDATMEQCSSHDVANLLKQFLRELPTPLLGYEYIDTLFEVCGKLINMILMSGRMHYYRYWFITGCSNTVLFWL